LTFNEVVQTRYYDQFIILPCQYNFRAHFRHKRRGWPAVDSLDGVKIYHNAYSMSEAEKLERVNVLADLAPLQADDGPLSDWEKFLRKIQLRLQPHHVK